MGVTYIELQVDH